jgi:hypothetical protein
VAKKKKKKRTTKKTEVETVTTTQQSYGTPMIITDAAVTELDAEKVSTMITDTNKPAANKLDVKTVKKLCHVLCHEYFVPEGEKDWEDCHDCILRDVPWQTKSGHKRDLCFAIHHEGILDG